MRDMSQEALKHSLSFAKTDEDWAARRKVFGTAFTKDKLQKMVEVIKESTIAAVKKWDSEFISKEAPMEVVQEMFELLVKITLKISFGFDIDEEMMPFMEDGEIKTKLRFG